MLPEAVVSFDGTDQTCLVVSATIRHGRDDPSSQPIADSATLELIGPLPASVDVGTTVTVAAQLGALDPIPRFAGRVTDIAVGWRSVDQPTAQIVAVGPLASMGRRIVGDTPWPAESDGARVNRVIGLAGVPTDAARTDPGSLTVLARDVDAVDALTVAQDAASDGAGVLWQATDGAVLYADANHRRGAQVSVALDACQLPLSVDWRKNLEGLVNDVRIRYGTAPEGGEQPELHASDAASVATRGTYGASLTTRLADAAAAAARADLALIRQAAPVWVLSGVSLDLELVSKLAELTPAQDEAATAAILGLEFADLISVTGLPAGSPYTTALLWVEGWTEQVAWGTWRTSFAVSGYCRTAAAPRWDDVDPAWTWGTISAAYTWDGTNCLPPVPPQGRWLDIPSSARWSTISPTVQWDQWS